MFHEENIILIIKILLNNGYPLDYIFKTINERIKHFLHKPKPINVSTTDTTTTSLKYFTLPYNRTLSGDMNKQYRKLNYKPVYKGFDKLNKFIKTQKDIVPHNSKNNVVYRIKCKNCDATYVGQTGRQLKTRINEHKKYINRNTTQQSVITNHCIDKNHEFDWDNILYTESTYYKRLISEMIFISAQRNI